MTTQIPTTAQSGSAQNSSLPTNTNTNNTAAGGSSDAAAVQPSYGGNGQLSENKSLLESNQNTSSNTHERADTFTTTNTSHNPSQQLPINRKAVPLSTSQQQSQNLDSREEKATHQGVIPAHDGASTQQHERQQGSLGVSNQAAGASEVSLDPFLVQDEKDLQAGGGGDGSTLSHQNNTTSQTPTQVPGQGRSQDQGFNLGAFEQGSSHASQGGVSRLERDREREKGEIGNLQNKQNSSLPGHDSHVTGHDSHFLDPSPTTTDTTNQPKNHANINPISHNTSSSHDIYDPPSSRRSNEFGTRGVGNTPHFNREESTISAVGTVDDEDSRPINAGDGGKDFETDKKLHNAAVLSSAGGFIGSGRSVDQGTTKGDGVLETSNQAPPIPPKIPHSGADSNSGSGAGVGTGTDIGSDSTSHNDNPLSSTSTPANQSKISADKEETLHPEHGHIHDSTTSSSGAVLNSHGPSKDGNTIINPGESTSLHPSHEPASSQKVLDPASTNLSGVEKESTSPPPAYTGTTTGTGFGKTGESFYERDLKNDHHHQAGDHLDEEPAPPLPPRPTSTNLGAGPHDHSAIHNSQHSTHHTSGLTSGVNTGTNPTSAQSTTTAHDPNKPAYHHTTPEPRQKTTTSQKLKAATKEAKSLAAGIHGIGEKIRGEINGGVDRAFGSKNTTTTQDQTTNVNPTQTGSTSHQQQHPQGTGPTTTSSSTTSRFFRRHGDKHSDVPPTRPQEQGTVTSELGTESAPGTGVGGIGSKAPTTYPPTGTSTSTTAGSTTQPATSLTSDEKGANSGFVPGSEPGRSGIVPEKSAVGTDARTTGDTSGVAHGAGTGPATTAAGTKLT